VSGTIDIEIHPIVSRGKVLYVKEDRMEPHSRRRSRPADGQKRIQKTYTVKSLNKGPFRRFDRFFEDSDQSGEERDYYLNAILSKLTIFALQISRIESRIAEYETRVDSELRTKYYLRDPVPRGRVVKQQGNQKS
jgi:hypothetical protein